MSSTPDSDALAAHAELQQALLLAQTGRGAEAIARLRNLLRRQPALLAARCLLGAWLHDAGETLTALLELDAAAALAPHDARVQELRATVLLALQRFDDAEFAARTALAADARRPHALLQLGLALDAQQRAEPAATALRELLALQPAHPLARRVLLRNLLRLGDWRSAAAEVRQSVRYDVSASETLAAEFCAVAPLAETTALLDALLAPSPRNYTFCLLYARALHQSGRSSAALAWSERAHALAPQAFEPLEMRAVSLIDRGEVDSGLAAYRELLARPDADADAASRYLILAHYDPRQDNEALFAAHQDWAQRYAQPFGAPFRFTGTRDPARKLRIGWLSPRFTGGPVASFFTGLLEAFDRTGFEHVLVALRAQSDDSTTRLRAAADRWLDFSARDDAALLDALRACEFDIVVDLAGHAVGNRLRVLAQRVAPVQLCWLDYFDTTAVGAMDGWISDAWLTPDASPQRYTERLLRLESGRFCYTPPHDAPEPQRLDNGAPVFASFNRLAKLNDAVLDAWAEILRCVPAARLALGVKLLEDEAARARTLERFAQRGIGAERLDLHGHRAYAELLQAYRSVDIALDPFPFSGCTTTCDALWMGVPVIARTGTTFVARQSASLLERLGAAQWIAGDDADYVTCAVDMAQRVGDLRAGRAALRERVRTQLCDAAAQARDFAALLRAQWTDVCAR